MALQFPSWLKSQPMVQCLHLDLPFPHLNDNTADLDRLVRAIKQEGYAPLALSPTQIPRWTRSIRSGDFKVSVQLGYNGMNWEILEVAPGLEEKPPLAFAVDLGTTRLCFYLLDLGTGQVLERASEANPQIIHGEDILTRILFARDAQNLLELQSLVRETFNQTLQTMLQRNGYSARQVFALAVGGNTTMSHLFLGLDPTHICREPYIPSVNRFPFYHASDLHLEVHPRALVYLFPNVGSYFGGDLIAGIIASGMHRSTATCLLVDVGTNAEVVMGNRDWLIACAGAAGPALEGGVIERGMMASQGAIDRIRIDPESLEVDYHVIGEEKPKGICGSGVIDLIAEMFMAGILTIQGKINTRLDSPRIVTSTDVPSYIIVFADQTADGQDLMISEIDVGIFLKSKAAMYTILTVIANKVGLSFHDLDRFYVAGTFGNFIDPAMAIRIGMLPDLPLEVYHGLHDTVGLGAAMLLLDRSLLADVEQVCDRITYVELNVNMELMNEFRGALFLPHTDPKLFPSVSIPERAFG
ncbi:MAG: ATP-binding protein [Deltaproteobacteria bacterium]|nr:ATP-binding protein [Deltaproteobacteria bacterium]